MILKEVIIHHFGPFKDTTLKLTEDGIYNIVGKNGSGKSTIRKAISWCIFGKCDGCKGAGDNMIKDTPTLENEMYVTTKFEHKGKDLAVTRTRIRNKSTTLIVEEIK
jgi:DNA repair exonuclease SbcCD ATPase subunit